MDRALATSLRRAREGGVTTFDLVHTGSLARAERWLASAFPNPDPTLLFIIGRTGRDPSDIRRPSGEPTLQPTDLLRELEDTLPADVERLRPYGSVMVEVDAGGAPLEQLRETLSALDRHRNDGLIAGWSWRRRGEALPSATESGVTPLVWSVELSLLDRSPLVALQERTARGPFGVLVRDPFSGGRLDGTRFGTTLAERGPLAPPPGIQSLHAQLDPILRLGFLTAGRRRTLAQAALQFLFRWPWVTSVLAPLPRPERWEEIVGAMRAPPLDSEELEELGVPSA